MPAAGTALFPLLKLTSPLGENVLVPLSLTLVEALNEPFLCTLDVASGQAAIAPDKLLGQPVSLEMRPQGQDDAGGKPRAVHGLVRRFVATGPHEEERDTFGYRLEIVPRLWFLSQAEDCRIFENKSAEEILTQLFKEAGFEATFRVAKPHPRPFTVQYNETNLAFATRLIEEEGWLYFFEHTKDKHTLVVADSTASFKKVPHGKVASQPGGASDFLTAWQPGRITGPAKITLADYEPEHPSDDAKQSVNSKSASDPLASVREVFHWPARSLKTDADRGNARLLMEAEEVAAAMAEGEGINEHFVPGARITVADLAGGKDFLICRVEHHANGGAATNMSEAAGYRNSFQAFPADMPFRPRRTVPRPRMDGLYSAMVIGPADEEIHTDELGRVKIRFRWDHRKDATAGGEIWVRVMQSWAGMGAGWQFIPRVNTEVAVAFVDGDAERPVVVGQLYNGDFKPPFTLPAQKTRSGLRTRSTPRGGSQDFSELWFDDKAGKEMVQLHAQKDLNVEVENDATYAIDNDRTTTVRNDDKLTVQQGSRTVDVPLGDHTIKSQTGNITIRTAAGAISVEALQSITLKVGQSVVKLDPSGVTIQGPMVKVEGQALTSLKGAITKLDADGMLQATAGIMMLN